MFLKVFLAFFFFQAEDGIRDSSVTGVQTCALPISVFLALEDETGMVNVTLWPDAWTRFRQQVRRHALLYIEGRLERESEVVTVIADRVESLSAIARPAGGPTQPRGVRHMGHAGMR